MSSPFDTDNLRQVMIVTEFSINLNTCEKDLLILYQFFTDLFSIIRSLFAWKIDDRKRLRRDFYSRRFKFC